MEIRKLALALPLALAAGCGGSDAAEVVDWRKTPVGLESVDALFVEPADNKMTAEKIALGKQLFFDTRLSKDGSTSCQTCHVHELGWSNGERFSKKVGGAINTRNSPPLYNLAYHDKLYWDGRADSLESNIAAAWQGHMNAGEDVAPLAAKIGAVPGYQEQFQTVFGAAATADSVAKALAVFVRSLRGGGSAWDRYEQTKDASLVSKEAIAGQKLFMVRAGCIVCHVPPLYTDRLFHIVGMGESDDIGRGKYDENLKGAFKTPTLRSVVNSGPYFHDGNVSDLKEAVKLMASGGGKNEHYPPNDPLLQDRSLVDQEIDQLVAFLKTLQSPESFTAPTLPK